jgi:hypothetical protein
MSLMIYLGLPEVLVVALGGGGRVGAVAAMAQQVEIVVVLLLAAAVKLRFIQLVEVAAQGLQVLPLAVHPLGPGVRELPTLLQELQEQVVAAEPLGSGPLIKQLAVLAVVAQEFGTALGPLEQLTQAVAVAGRVEVPLVLNREALAALELC